MRLDFLFFINLNSLNLCKYIFEIYLNIIADFLNDLSIY
jgi:hypothetical protein